MNLKSNLIVAMAALSAMTMSFASCSDDLDGNEEETKNEEPSVMVSANVSAALGTNKTKTRAGIGMSENSNGMLSYNFAQLYTNQESTGEAAFDLLVTSKYNDADYTTVLFEDIPIKKSSDGTTYYISLFTDQLPVPSTGADDLANVDFCGMLVPNGTGEQFQSIFTNETMKSMGELATLGGNFFVPLYSSTTNTSKTVNGGGQSTNSTLDISMQFSMMGSVVKVEFTDNPLAHDVYIDSVRLKNCNFKSDTITWTMGDEDDNGRPNFTFKNRLETGNKKLDFPQSMLVKSNLCTTETEGSNTAYSWVMPVSDDDLTLDYDIYYHIKGDVYDDNGTQVDYNTNSMVVTYQYPESGTPTTYEGGIQYGTVNKLEMKMPESDLMITEFEHLNPGAGGSNYSMIELYNPTSSPIDLRDYGLVRLTSFQHPSSASDAELETSSIYLNWLGYNGSSDTESGTFDQARVQDIYVDLTGFTYSTSVEYGGPTNCKTVDGTQLSYNNSFVLFDQTHKGSRTYPSGSYNYAIDDHSYSGTLEDYQIGPGQTVIVGASSIEYYVMNNRPKNSLHDCWHSGANYFNSYYLDNAAKSGRLKFAIAVDNGSSKNAAGSSANSGVMQHVRTGVMQLVKKNGSTYDIIDMPGYMENTPARYIYYEYIYGTGGTSRDYFVFTRNASALYPMYLVDKQVYTDQVAFKWVLDRLDDGAITSGKAYRMYDWIWRYPSNFNITGVNQFTLEEYLNNSYSPGTKTFEQDLHTTTYTE